MWRLAWGRGGFLGFPASPSQLLPFSMGFAPAPPRQQEGKGELASEGPHKASSSLFPQPWPLVGLVQPELETLHKGRGPRDCQTEQEGAGELSEDRCAQALCAAMAGVLHRCASGSGLRAAS